MGEQQAHLACWAHFQKNPFCIALESGNCDPRWIILSKLWRRHTAELLTL